jgi:hypothetical protein
MWKHSQVSLFDADGFSELVGARIRLQNIRQQQLQLPEMSSGRGMADESLTVGHALNSPDAKAISLEPFADLRGTELDQQGIGRSGADNSPHRSMDRIAGTTADQGDRMEKCLTSDLGYLPSTGLAALVT